MQPARRGRGRGRGSVGERGGGGAAGGEWWRALEGDDMISLEPLCELAYEPFALRSAETKKTVSSGGGVDAYNYFDGKILSSYLISSGNFCHPVSRRPLSRDECEALDRYMQRHNLGHAGVTHVFDLKASADATDNMASRRHLEALQREATDILQSLFSAGTNQSDSARRHYQQLQRGGDAPSRPAGHAGGQDESGWVIVDDDEQMGLAMSQQTEDMMWPALPPAPERPRQASWGAQPVADAGGGAGAQAPEALIDDDTPQPPRTDPGPQASLHDLLAPKSVDLSLLRSGGDGAVRGRGGGIKGEQTRRQGFWSAAAWAALDGSRGGAQVILERQMGGIAQDRRFAEEIRWVDQQVEAGGGGKGGLQALGFSVTRIVALHRTALEERFVDACVGLSRSRRAAGGWQVCRVPEGERNGGRLYLWNKRTLESCWSLDDEADALDTHSRGVSPALEDGESELPGAAADGDVAEGKAAEGGAFGWGTARMIAGSKVMMTWAPVDKGR